MALRRLVRCLIALGSVGLLCACSKDESSTSATAEPAADAAAIAASDDDGEDRSAAFIVELLHRNTYPFLGSGRLELPGAADAGVIATEFEFESPPDGRLSIVVPHEPADASFLGLPDGGMPLFDEGVPAEGARSQALTLYTLEPGDGGDLRVSRAPGRAAAELFIESISSTGFRAELRLPSGFGSGVFTVHRPPGDMFRVAHPPGAELADFVTAGDAEYFHFVDDGTNFSSLVAPGLYVVHESGEPLFTRGEPDRGLGLERLAEDGNPFPLVEELTGTLARIDAFPDAKIAYEEGQETKESSSYSFVVFAEPGDRLSIAGMLAQTNDVFVATAPRGIPLFVDDEPIKGDFTSELFLWDAGTEVNERPGYGPHQATRQPKPNSGESESEPVDRVTDGFDYPPLEDLLVFTISGG